MVIYKNFSEFTENLQKFQEYIGALDEERKKIQVFERELPLCLELVSQAIERCRQQMTESFDGQCDQYSDQTSCEGPVFEEFIPMKSASSTKEDIDDHQQQKQKISHQSKFNGSEDWLASAQLSIQAPDPPIEEDFLSKKLTMEEHRNGCESIHHFLTKKPTISSSENKAGGGGDGSYGGGGHDDGNNGADKGPSKKERRCWSPELHRRFLHALQQLGGAHVATPKQIKDLMKVNGLTNDEIKSHLQKYRLHTRRLNATPHNDAPTPQLVVVGQIWMPPLDYTTSAVSSPLIDDIKKAQAVYAPVASLPPSCTIASPYKTKKYN